MSSPLTPERLTGMRRVLDAAAAALVECGHATAKLDHISIRATYPPGEPAIFDEAVMSLPELVQLIDRSDDWASWRAAKDAEIERLRKQVDGTLALTERDWIDILADLSLGDITDRPRFVAFDESYCLSRRDCAKMASQLARRFAHQAMKESDATEGVIPRRFDDWHEDDGSGLWWNVGHTEGEIIEDPSYIGQPRDSDWPWVEADEQHLLWVPLPRLVSARPRLAVDEGGAA